MTFGEAAVSASGVEHSHGWNGHWDETGNVARNETESVAGGGQNGQKACSIVSEVSIERRLNQFWFKILLVKTLDSKLPGEPSEERQEEL